jgi:hypothetical protein
VRHIYIIVSDEHQIPAWFKPHPMVTFVYHRQVPPCSLPSGVSEYSLRVPLPTSPVATIRVARAALPSASSPIAESAQCTVPRNALVCGQQGRPTFSPTRKLAASPTAELPLSAHPMRLGVLASCLTSTDLPGRVPAVPADLLLVGDRVLHRPHPGAFERALPPSVARCAAPPLIPATTGPRIPAISRPAWLAAGHAFLALRPGRTLAWLEALNSARRCAPTGPTHEYQYRNSLDLCTLSC